MAREGVELVHDAPSAESLAEIPEVDFSRARARPNTYASRAAEAVAQIQYGRGRPKAGNEVGPTPARSLRLPQAAWDALEVEARAKRTTVHGLLRDLVVLHLERNRSRR
jgi:hypothetical protein